MIAWLGHAPLPLLTAAVFLAVYLAAAVVIAVLVLVRRWGHGDVVGPLSPGLLAPMGLIFGLLVGFLVADVWSDRDDAAAAVSQEASALRDIDLLMGTFPAQQPEVRALLRDQIEQYVAVEWPQMADGRATISVAPAGLVQVQDVVLSLPVRAEGERVAEGRLVDAVDAALEARRTRLVLSGSAIDPLRLTALFLVAVTTLAATACVHADRVRRAAVSLALLGTAMALALTLLCAQAAPFAGYFAIDPDLLLQVRPAP
ncbi:DUF4239 domain-containing protein [Actinomycetospora chibensis]|uniref:DUF4239 domain-containing protein n=1 Tax=Actinomycetospora chibensis TaxID=663606 RepID=A0ABV9RCC5_9PSEU|nr:DUF4239 domain-containing protein [Actinomycetospora chibensis]MDD7925577.1 DUF4239 domain-containing protein [Actinomycetospora chibensis]